MSEQTAQRPFDIGYVLSHTARHMRKSIEISIQKTVNRIPEFAGDRAKSEEVFMTLSALHALKSQVDEFLAAYNSGPQGEQQ